MNKLARESRERAVATGRLPHEILLDMARGQPVTILRLDPTTGLPEVDTTTGELRTKVVIPTLEEMKDAAKAAAPYYAPKISTVEVIQGVSDGDLDAIIASAAAAAGISLGAVGEGEEREDAEGEAGVSESSSFADKQPTILRRRTVTRS